MTTGPQPGWGAPEVALGLLLGAFAAGAFATWGLGAVAGSLFGAGAPSVQLADLPGVLAALPSHLDDPRNAWPRDARAALPGPDGFLGAAVILIVAGAGMTYGAVAVVGRLRDRDTRGARWARARDLGDLRVSRATQGRLTLGRRGRALLAAEPAQSVIVIAPTQTGKTTGLAIPALLEWNGPVVATSIKTDLVADTHGRRRQLGEVAVFDPTGVTGLRRAFWTPLASCGSWEGARATAERLCAVAKPGHGVADGDFWTAAAARYLAPLLYAAACAELEIVDVVRWVDDGNRDRPTEILAGLTFDDTKEERVAAQAALAILNGIFEGDDRLRSSLAATAGIALNAYGDPTVSAQVAGPVIDPGWLLSGSNTTYLCATATGQERLRPLFVALLDEIIDHVYAVAASTGKPIDPPLLIVLDEAANIAPLPRVDQLAATGAGQGIQLVTVVQDLAQLEQRWGKKSDTIVNNHRAKLFGPGIACEKTLGYLARILGDEAIDQRSVTRGEQGRRSSTVATTYRALSSADRTRQGEAGTALLVYGSLPPARISLRPWYADRGLSRLRGTSR